MKLLRRSVIVGMFFATACSDGTGPESSSLSLSVALGSGTAAADPVGRIFSAADVTLNDGTSELVLQRVAIVLREVELDRMDGDDCVDGDGEDDCEEFEVGPRLLELPMDGSVEAVMAIQVPPGTYDELEFDIHKPDSTEDSAFVEANPAFADISIRVEGTFDGTPFVYTTDVNGEQEIELVPPLVVDDDQSLNVTLLLDVGAWFRDGAGSLLDPASANSGGPNESQVNNNIQNSIDAFEDNDSDGEEDEG